MKNYLKKILAVSFVLLSYNLMAQDFHFSQHYMSPMETNPALVGQFNGCFRMNANYRSQWGPMMGSSAYRTMAGSADMPLLKEQMKGNFIGVGLDFSSDKAGDVSYGTQAIGFNFGYCKILNKKKPLTISAAFRVANWNKKIDVSSVTLTDMSDLANISKGGISFMDFGVGTFMFHQPLNWLSYNFGIAAFHVNSINQTFVKLNDNFGKKINIHTSAYIQVSDAYTLIPTILYINQLKARELQINIMNKVLIDDNGSRETAIYFGLGTRVAHPSIDAMMAYFRVDFNHVSIGLSYDFNVSGLHYTSKSVGGPELALQYLINCPKSKETVYNKRKKMFCPKF
jgi:type IX secretion system PorP/SprF family membrane protein